jgi:hypothetical protein
MADRGEAQDVNQRLMGVRKQRIALTEAAEAAESTNTWETLRLLDIFEYVHTVSGQQRKDAKHGEHVIKLSKGNPANAKSYALRNLREHVNMPKSWLSAKVSRLLKIADKKEAEAGTKRGHEQMTKSELIDLLALAVALSGKPFSEVRGIYTKVLLQQLSPGAPSVSPNSIAMRIRQMYAEFKQEQLEIVKGRKADRVIYNAVSDLWSDVKLRGYLGTDLPSVNPRIRSVDCPFTGERLAAVPALNPDVTILHAQRADRRHKGPRDIAATI